ncbi:MAG: DUF4412 domain-containing protein [Armatimonadota bacterium]
MNKSISVILIILVIGALAVLAYQSISLTPAKVMEKMTSKLMDVKYYHYTADVDVTGTINKTEGSMKLKIDSDVDITDKKSPGLAGTLKMAVDFQGVQVSGEADITMADKNFYLKLTKIPQLLEKMKSPIAVSKFKDTWIKINLDKYKNANTEMPLDEAKQKEMEAELKAWMKERKVEKLPAEKVEGINCFHYGLTLDKTAIMDLIERMQKFAPADSPKQDPDKLSKQMDALSDIQLEMWIGKRDFMPHKLTASTQITPPGQDEKINVLAIALYSNFGKKVDIQPPAESIDLEKIIAEFTKKFTPPGKAQKVPGMIKLPPGIKADKLPPGIEEKIKATK